MYVRTSCRNIRAVARKILIALLSGRFRSSVIHKERKNLGYRTNVFYTNISSELKGNVTSAGPAMVFSSANLRLSLVHTANVVPLRPWGIVTD